jgi:hypothetical protein
VALVGDELMVKLSENGNVLCGCVTPFHENQLGTTWVVCLANYKLGGEAGEGGRGFEKRWGCLRIAWRCLRVRRNWGLRKDGSVFCGNAAKARERGE